MRRALQSELVWTPTTEALLWAQMHAKRRRWKSGGRCLFFKLNRLIGAKLYRKRDERDFAVMSQQRALESHFAPRLGGTFEVHMPFVSRYGWASETQHCCLYGYLSELAYVGNGHWESEELSRLHAKMEEAGFSTSDAEWQNVGRIDGRLVCVDFDKESHPL
jgi:hypothetical protein